LKLGIMQPYFFPYIGYFELIYRTDRWVVFDIVQYNKKSWMNRNRVLHPSKGWQYINLPAQKHEHGTLIHQIRAADPDKAFERISGQLEHYRKRAPYFREVMDLLRRSRESASERLVDINVAGLKAVCDYLGIDFDYSLCSEMQLDLISVEHAGQWALKIASQLGADEYLNPPGGKEIFDRAEWEAASIRLSFTEMRDFSYACGDYEFEPNLSILDVLMWNDPETVVGAISGA
jgi:hypothetical protein